MSSILDSVTSAFGPDVLKSLGGALGADPSAVGKAMGAVGPLLLSGMSRATEAPGGADALMKMLPQDHGGLGNLGGPTAAPQAGHRQKRAAQSKRSGCQALPERLRAQPGRRRFLCCCILSKLHHN